MTECTLAKSWPRAICLLPAVTGKREIRSHSDEKRTEDYAMASVCIDEVFGGVAETAASSVRASGKPVQAGLLPLHHVAIVSA